MNKITSIINNLGISDELELLIIINIHILRDIPNYWDEKYQTNLYKESIEKIREGIIEKNNVSQEVRNILRNRNGSYSIKHIHGFWLATAVYCIINSDSITLQNSIQEVVIKI